jgi:hypothetical protein
VKITKIYLAALSSLCFGVWASAAELAALCGLEAGTRRGAEAPEVETRPVIPAWPCGTTIDVQKQVAFCAAARSLGDRTHVVASVYEMKDT